jgi:hypothetical protein
VVFKKDILFSKQQLIHKILGLGFLETTEETADYVSNGGHGTRVAGAVLYPRTIPLVARKKLFAGFKMPEFLMITVNYLSSYFRPIY